MQLANEELQSTSEKDPPRSFDLPVPQKSDDDDDDFHVANTPMANRLQVSCTLPLQLVTSWSVKFP